MSKHDQMYIEKFQPQECRTMQGKDRTYLLVGGSDRAPDKGIVGMDFTNDFGDVFVAQVDKKKGPESCDSDPLKTTRHTKPKN